MDLGERAQDECELGSSVSPLVEREADSEDDADDIARAITRRGYNALPAWFISPRWIRRAEMRT